MGKNFANVSIKLTIRQGRWLSSEKSVVSGKFGDVNSGSYWIE